MTEATVTRGPLEQDATWSRIAVRPDTDVDGVRIGEWTLTRAAFTDRHQHAEINAVIDGVLHVTCAGETHVLGPGRPDRRARRREGPLRGP